MIDSTDLGILERRFLDYFWENASPIQEEMMAERLGGEAFPYVPPRPRVIEDTATLPEILKPFRRRH